MKKLVTSLVLLVSLMFSCQKQIDLLSGENPNSEVSSMISDIEKSGTKLFKKEVIIYDSSKLNSINLLVAAHSQSDLDNYLAQVTIELTLFKNGNLNNYELEKTTLNEKTDNLSSKDEPIKRIYTEVVSKNFKETFKMYSLNFKQSTKNKKSLKVQDQFSPWSSNDFHQSNRFDDWIKVTRNYTGVGSLDNSIHTRMYYKSCALCFWQEEESKLKVIYAEDSDQSNSSTTDARRLGTRVLHNYYNYTVTCGNW
jgi:hypothetical protein